MIGKRFRIWWHRTWLRRALEINHDSAYMASLTVYQRLDIEATIRDHRRMLSYLLRGR